MTPIRFILNEPRNPQNIGVAARGMANFGFRELAVVAPYDVAWDEIRSATSGSEPVVEKALKFKTLPEALKGMHLVIGTSAGSRRGPDARWMDLDKMQALVKKSGAAKKKVAILFGSERSGLSQQDLSYCHALVRLPTVPECPSMNLGQAVTVMSYALCEKSQSAPVKKDEIKNVPSENIDRLVTNGVEAMKSAGLLKGWTPASAHERLRASFLRWDLSSVDVAVLHGLFRAVINAKEKP